MDNKNENVNGTEQTQSSQDLEACKAELAQIRERYLYLTAEFDNYKKRLEKERSSWIEQSQDAVLLDILPIVDDMERALIEIQQLPPEHASHLKGIELIAKSLSKLLKKYDIEEIPVTRTFDPAYFEAVMQVSAEGYVSGEIVSVLQKGYMRKGQVLRPAKVSVAQ